MGNLFIMSQVGDNIQKSIWMKKTWKYAQDTKSAVNYAGYGASKPYQPPLANPEFLGTLYYKQSFTFPDLFLGPQNFFMAFKEWVHAPMFWICALIFGGNQNQWYNNSYAQGNQLYPTGVHLFYDMFSWNGWTAWLMDMLENTLWQFAGLFIFPWKRLIPMFDGSVKTTNSDLMIWAVWGNFLLPTVGYWIYMYCMFTGDNACQLE